MSDVVSYYYESGRTAGEAKGKEAEQCRIVANMLRRNDPISDIMDAVEISREKVMEIARQFNLTPAS